MSVLEAVQPRQITQRYTKARSLADAHHYYWPDLKRSGLQPILNKKEAPIKSSSELLVIDRIKSVLEYTQRLEKALIAIGTDKTAVVAP
jgi:hypothetical protein